MRIADHDLLVVDQVTSFFANDFAIRDASGAPVGDIRTEGGALSRMVMGTRRLAVHEADGTLALRVLDVVSFGRDRFQLVDGSGAPLAEVVKEFTLFAKRLSLHCADGQVLDLRGSFFDYDFEVVGPLGVAARVSRQWPGLASGLLGRERYVIGFGDQVPATLRYAVLGGVVALDLVRAKDQGTAASTWPGI